MATSIKAGIVRPVSGPRSTTASRSTQVAPAFLKSVLRDGQVESVGREDGDGHSEQLLVFFLADEGYVFH